MRVLIGIYQILNIVTGKFYVGKSVNISKRWYNHQSQLRRNVSKTPYLQAAWNKYGERAFEFIVIELCEPANLVEREQFWMDNLGAYDRELGYNLNPNSETSLGVKRSQITKDKISAANKGNKWSPEAKAKIKGRQPTEETKRKILETKTANGKLSNKGTIAALKGNSRRRDKSRWPHELGVKCKCNECRIKRLDLYHRPKYKKEILGAEF